MSTTVEIFPPALRVEKAMALALRLAHAENALHAFTSGQVDAIISPDGKAYLLRPGQEQLRQSESRWRAMVESAADLIAVVDRSGKVVSQNRATSRLLGYAAGRLVGESLFDLVHPEDLARLHSAFFNVIEELRAEAIVQIGLRHDDGFYRTLEATVSKLHDGTMPQVVMICRDVTRRPRGEEAARQLATLAEATKTRDRFLAMLSHELRTPLAPALLHIQELQKDERFLEARPALTVIRRNLELQLQLLDDLMDFTVVGQHRVQLPTESIDAHEAVRFALEICRSEIAAARIGVTLHLRALESRVVASSTRLQQIMWNLIKNAVKFSTPGGRISIVSANDAAGGLILEFVDHGIGIEPQLLPLVFDAFQQGDPLKQPNGSFGLGLFIARGLAEAQGGTLTAFSEGHGKGATFRLKLTQAPPAPPIPTTDQ